MKYLIVVNDFDKKRIVKKISSQRDMLNIKVVGYREFQKKWMFDYSKETIFYICENYHVTQEIAEIYLKNLYYITNQSTHNHKINFLKKLKEDLETKQLITKNLLWKDHLKNQTVVFYHVKNDEWKRYFIEECQKITKVQELNWSLREENTFEVKKQEDKEQEVIGVCSDICKLIKKGMKPSQIFLTNLDSEYRELLKKYQNIFHIPMNLKEDIPYISNQIVVEFLNSFDQGMLNIFNDLKEKYQKKEEQDILKIIADVCNDYSFIKEEAIRKNYIIEELKKRSKVVEPLLEAVNEIDFIEQEVEEDAFVFVLGAYEGNFPKIKKDENYLSEKELEELGWNTITEQNELRKIDTVAKLKSFSHVFLSYPLHDGKLELYPSSVLENLKISLKEVEEDFSNSNLFNKLMLAKKKDFAKKYGTYDDTFYKLQNTYPKISYATYQNSFQTFNMELPKLKLSYTALDKFFHCAFRYYLDYVLKIKQHEETFGLKIGRVFHQVLNDFYKKDFNFETSWEESIQKEEWNNEREIFFRDKLKEELKRTIHILKKQEEGKDFGVLTEENVSVQLDNQDELIGIIDKLFYKTYQNHTLISIVDYKTGTPNTNLDDVCYGLSMQLPIYLVLLRKLPFKNKKIIGFYLQKIISSIPEKDNLHTEEELKEKNLKLQGYSVDEESVLKEFDPTYENSKLIASMKKSSKGFYAYSKVLSEEQMETLEQITLKNIKEATAKIHRGEFFINPKRINRVLVGCEHCEYQDVCYLKEENIVDLKRKKIEEVLGGEEDANLDRRTEGSYL